MSASRARADSRPGEPHEQSAEASAADDPESRPADVASASAEEILARLEAYAAARGPDRRRPADAVARSDTLLPPARRTAAETRAHERRAAEFARTTLAALPSEFIAAILGCAATILAFVFLALPAAAASTSALAIAGLGTRRMQSIDLPGAGLLIGTILGAVLVVTA